MIPIILNTIFRSMVHLCAFAGLALMTHASTAADFPEPGDATQGGKLWADNCTRCHNMRSPTDLTDEQWITSVFHMRARAGLTGQEARDILSFLQAANGQASAPNANVVPAQYSVVNESNSASDGKAIYETSCIACHGGDGKGTLPGVPDLTEAGGRLSKSNTELLTNIINGLQSPGSPMPMPARGGNAQLSDADLNAVLAYLNAEFKP